MKILKWAAILYTAGFVFFFIRRRIGNTNPRGVSWTPTGDDFGWPFVALGFLS